MTDFPTVSAGTPSDKSPTTSASWVNAVSDAAQDFQLRKAAGEAANGRGLTNSSGLVSVKNLTGSDLLRGAYVQLGDYLQTAVGHRRPIFEGNLYDVAENGRIAILTKAAKQNIFEDARTIGVCTARINITNTGHRFAAPSNGLTILQSAASGPVEILSTNKISGTGEQELTVQIGGGNGGGDIYECIVTTPISAHSAGTAEIFTIADDFTLASIGTSPLYNPFGIYAKGTGACHATPGGQSFVLTGPTLIECTAEPVISVDCDEVEGLTYDTQTINYAAVECAAEPPVAAAKIVSTSIQASTQRRFHALFNR